MRIDLPNGAWAELRRPEDVTERQRRPLTKAMRGVRPEIVDRGREIASMDDGPDGKPTPDKQAAQQQLQYDMTNEEADCYQLAGDLAAVALVESWSFTVNGEPIPLTLDGLLDLPARSLDALRLVVGPLVNDLFLDAEVNKATASPFAPSNGSATPSTEAPQTVSLTSGAPTVSSSSESA
jgi:hypothetical protein